MFSPMERQSERKICEEPVKCRPAKSRDSSTVVVAMAGSAGMKLITPGGRPACCRIWKKCQLASADFCDGFQRQTLPIRAGPQHRLAPMAVKLKGLTE